jgi:predicted DsbA family dithiol-disulfide isomerase
MPTPLRIDFVSDVACPWCAVGLNALERALDNLQDEVMVQIHFQPFELNPQMPAEGEDADEHLSKKYGLAPEQLAKNRESLRQRGAELGFVFNQRKRVYNTFDAHRLLHWAGVEGGQAELKHALLRAYFTDSRNVSDREVLVDCAVQAGLDGTKAREVLTSGLYSDEVRTQEKFFTDRGIQAVPSVIINGQHLIQGGQPAEVFENALRHIAAQNAAMPVH